MAARAIQDIPPSDSPQLSIRAVVEMCNRVPVDRVMIVLEGLLDASMRDGFPDWRARTDGVKLWLSYVVGLPVQRSEIVQHKIVSRPDSAALLSNPATVESLAKRLRGTEAGATLLRVLQSPNGEAVTEKRASGKTLSSADTAGA